MIARLRGEVIERSASSVVVDVGGVGYLLTVSVQGSFRVGDRVDLHVHTAVRDDAIALFGFAQREEKELFDLLIGVPGVGPVKAMGILQTSVSTFIELVARREPARLAKLPGVGKKTAERILVDLGDKISALGPSSGGASDSPSSSARPEGPPILGDLVSALVNLGFKESVAVDTAQASLASLGDEAQLDQLLRDALARNRRKGVLKD